MTSDTDIETTKERSTKVEEEEESIDDQSKEEKIQDIISWVPVWNRVWDRE